MGWEANFRDDEIIRFEFTMLFEMMPDFSNVDCQASDNVGSI